VRIRSIESEIENVVVKGGVLLTALRPAVDRDGKAVRLSSIVLMK